MQLSVYAACCCDCHDISWIDKVRVFAYRFVTFLPTNCLFVGLSKTASTQWLSKRTVNWRRKLSTEFRKQSNIGHRPKMNFIPFLWLTFVEEKEGVQWACDRTFSISLTILSVNGRKSCYCYSDEDEDDATGSVWDLDDSCELLQARNVEWDVITVHSAVVLSVSHFRSEVRCVVDR